jgi:hypothetical protein
MTPSEKRAYLLHLLERASQITEELYPDPDPTVLPLDAASLIWGLKGALRSARILNGDPPAPRPSEGPPPKAPGPP